MTKSQELALRRSEIRQRLNEVAKLEGEALTDEIRAEADKLTTEFRDVETRWRAATVAEGAEAEEHRAEFDAGGNGDGETAELRALRGRVRLGAYFGAAAEERAVDGVEAEYSAARGIRGGFFPLDLLAPEAKRPELRAETAADAQSNQGTWLDRLFATTAAMHMGITFESVMPGIASFPVTTAGAGAAQRGREELTADAAWTVGVTELKPTRNAVRAVFTVEDAMRLPTLEEALRRDLSMALTEGVDRAIFEGDSGADENDVTGIQTAANVVEQEVTQAHKIKGGNVLAAFANLIDGKHAAMASDLRTVLTVGAYRLWMHTLANSGNAVDTTILEFLRRAGIEVIARGGIESNTAAGDFGAFIGRGRGIEGAGVAAIWNAGQLVRDPYTSAAKGEVSVTLNHLWAFGLPRATNFARVKFVA